MNRDERHRDHITRRVERLEAADRAFVPRRIQGFAGGILAAVAGSFFPPPVPGLALLVGILLFAITVLLHQRLARRLRAWREYLGIVARERARHRLDWAALPPLPPVADPESYFSDLDIVGPTSLLRRLDATVSTLGFATLVDQFRSDGIAPAEVERRQRLVRELTPRRRFHRRFQLAARLAADGGDTHSLQDALSSPFHSPSAVLLTAALAASQLAGLVGLGFFALRGTPPWFVLAWAVSFLLYGVGAKHFYDPFGRAQRCESALRRFLGIARFLETARFPAGSGVADLLAPYHGEESPSGLLGKLATPVSFLSVQANPYAYLILNFFLPWSYAFSLWAERVRLRLEARLPEWLSRLARLEALLSLAELARNEPGVTFPELLPESDAVFLDAEALGHPLIPASRRVTNPLRLGGGTACVLLTGSNMSGKSTFLRSAGVNLLLAKAGGPVVAGRFRFQPLDVLTSLRIADSIEDQVSSFYAEVKRLAEVLRAAGTRPVLYLIDEIFRGTNNRERLTGSRAYLRALVATRSAGLVSTHDLELAELERQEPRIVNFHFRESIEGDRMFFPYHLERGPCPTTNALRIMELAGLPIASS